MTNPSEFMQWSLALFLLVLEATIIALIWLGSGRLSRPTGIGINLGKLISEQDGSASFSRFQFLIFTFVIASAYVVCAFASVAKGGGLPSIDGNVLGLIGISGGSYVVSKGIEHSAGADQATASPAAGASTTTAGTNPPTYG